MAAVSVTVLSRGIIHGAGELIKIKVYRGYGQILYVTDDGTETYGTAKPEDPVLGIQIFGLDDDKEPHLKVQDVALGAVGEVQENLRQAVRFCREYTERKAELLTFN